MVIRSETEETAQLLLGLLIARPFKASLTMLPASGRLSPGQQHQYLAALRALCPASLRFLDLMWQLRNSLHAAPDWQRERLADGCDLDDLIDLLKWPYTNRPVSNLARLTWIQPETVAAVGTGMTSSLLLAARGTCPLGCYYDPPVHTADEPTQTSQPQLTFEGDVSEVGHSNSTSMNNDHARPPDPEPPPTPGPRRNPSRIARPACRDVSDYPLLSMSEMLPGRIPDDIAKELIAQGGPDLIRHPQDHRHMWIRPSHHCPGGGYGIIFRLDTNVPRGYLVGIYCGPTNELMNLTYDEAVKAWDASDYLMGYPQHNYVVDGDLTSGPTRANEGFQITNCFFVYNPIYRWVELRLKGCGQPGYYEGLVNYTEPHRPSSYWTTHRVSLLPPAARANCRSFYSSERRFTSVQSGNAPVNKTTKSKKKKASDVADQDQHRPIQEFFETE